jgi:ParB family transcriptional regulator, chromosome partitioning protein
MAGNKRLGKGLAALIKGADLTGGVLPEPGDTGVNKVSLDDIGFNVDQPRKVFDTNKLEELADSIKQVGVLQPVLVKKLQPGEKIKQHPDSGAPLGGILYSVVAGERRVRATRLAGLTEIPAIVCSYEETEALKVALLENIQREDLGPVEEGEAYRNLMDSYGATQEELASMLGKKRSSVANMLRILTLEKEILNSLQEGNISRGHAKALLGMPSGPARIQLARLCHSRGLSVRDVERRVQVGGGKPKRQAKTGKKAIAAEDNPVIREYTNRAEQVFGTPVTVERNPKDGKGSISVRFYSDSDLLRLLQIMGIDTDV